MINNRFFKENKIQEINGMYQLEFINCLVGCEKLNNNQAIVIHKDSCVRIEKFKDLKSLEKFLKINKIQNNDGCDCCDYE